MVEGHNLKWKGLQMKLIAFRKYIQEKTQPGDIVMMMDVNDVLFVAEPQNILDAYQVRCLRFENYTLDCL